jgi:threonine dehydratase
MGLRAVICMSRLVPENKLAAIRALGAEARIVGASQDEAHEEALRLVEEDGLAMVPPFDDLAVIAGQGTLGLEMVEDLPDVETVLIPLSGGGLLAGVAGAMKALRPGPCGWSASRCSAARRWPPASRPASRCRWTNCRRWPIPSAAAWGSTTGTRLPWCAN